MATITKIVRGRYFDGCTSSDTGYVAEKISAVIEVDAGGIENVVEIDCFRAGGLLVAVIVYTEVL